MLFKEVVTAEHLQHLYKLQIFATDLDQDAIDKARNGYYTANIAADVSVERLNRFFTKEEQSYRIHKDIREMVIFAKQNIIMDPPFTKLDVLSCRNLMIYLGPELQKRLLPLFHFALTGPGVLLLGNSESINNFNNLFDPIDNTYRLYQRIERPLSNINIEFPTKYYSVPNSTSAESQNAKSVSNIQTLIDQFLLQNYAPAAVVVNSAGDILYINGRTGKYLEPAAGKANWNIHAMAREGLAHKLTSALKTAQSQTEAVLLAGLSIGTNGGTQTVNVTVQAISKPDALKDMLIILFHDVLQPAARRTRKAPNAEEKALLLELKQSQEELQCLREEMQTSQEELKSSNEELQSTNEELQSTNEELTTSKEEMQSLNEELRSMNVELQSKVTDLSWVNNDMKNLLNSMEIATVFLDNNLHVRRFTSHATQLFKLIGSDIGRPLTDIATELDYPQLQTDALAVLNTLVYCEKQVQTHDNRWFTVRIMPYRTQENVIDGVVMTFIDISKLKMLENRLEQTGK
jgi:chemotaxis protein methyltransferase CheR/two-component system CheB/CheR fusion protein